MNIPNSVKDRGYLVTCADGSRGCTRHGDKKINGKIVVYKETTPNHYSDKGTLCDPKTLKFNGFID